MSRFRPSLNAYTAAGLVSLLSTSQSFAQLAPSGTPGDRAVYTIGAQGTIADVAALPSAVVTHDFDTETIPDTAGSFALGADESADDAKVFLTGGHHLVIYGQEWDGSIERSGADSYLKLGGTRIPYGHASAYTRDTTNRTSFVRGGTIIEVTQGDFLEVESQRVDVFQAAADQGNRPLTMQNADLQLIKLDDANLDFLRLTRSSATQLMAIGNSTPTNVPFDVQDEYDTASFDHNTATDSDQITLKTPGHYLVFVNTGISVTGGNLRQCISQKIFLDDDGAGANPPALVTGGATTLYLRNASIADGAGGLIREGAASVGVLVEVTQANSVLTVQISRDSTGANQASVDVDATRTGLAIAKLPDYGDFISLGETDNSNNADINTTGTIARSFGGNSNFSNDSFTYDSGASASQIVIKKPGDYLFLGSHYVEDFEPSGEARTVVKQGFQTVAGGAVGYGAGGAYNRDQPAATQAARDSGDWAGALLRAADIGIGGGVEATTEQIGNNLTVPPTGLSFQAINITSISIQTGNDPVVVINAPLQTAINETGSVLSGVGNLFTDDDDTLPAGLTYTVTSAVAGGTLRLSGAALSNGGTFTQEDLDNGDVTFDSGTTEEIGGFDFSVSDGSASDTGSFIVNIQAPLLTVSISDDGNTPEGGESDFILTADVAPVGANATVTVAYSGTASSGTDFTGATTVDILDGATSALITITTLNDGLLEGAETITATITNVTGTTIRGAVGDPASATLAITDGPNSAPVGAGLEQAIVGSGNVALGEISVSDGDTTYDSVVTTADSALFEINGITNTTVYSDGRGTLGVSHDVDLTGPALDQASGFSVDLSLIPQAADLIGTVLIWEIGGSSNGTSIHLVDGVPHLLSKAGGAPADAPTDDLSVPGAFTDLDWAGDDTIVVPLNGANTVSPGVPTRIAIVFDIANNTVKSSVNGSAEETASLSNNDSNDWRGDHTVNIVSTVTGIGGANDTGSGGFNYNGTDPIKGLVNGNSAVSRVRFWNEATGSATPTSGAADSITATLTIVDWASSSNGTLTTTSGNGETFVSGVWTVSGDSSVVNAALAAVEFVTGGSTTDPTLIQISFDDGDEDGGGPVSGTVYYSPSIQDPVYVDASFTGNFGDQVTDADLGAGGSQSAAIGVSAFSTIGAAIDAVIPGGTIIVNDGDYSSEIVSLTGTVNLQLADTVGPVQIGDLNADLDDTIDLQGNTLELGAANLTTGAIAAEISGRGNLTKVGTGRITLWAPASYTGSTTILGGFLRVGQNVGLDESLQSELSGDGPVVVTAPGRLEFVVALDKTISQTGAISGDGSVATFNDGTLIFDGAGANSFSGGFILGDGGVSRFDGVDEGEINGFVVVNRGDHLGSGSVLSRGSQLRAGSPGVVIANDVNVTGGGFRCGGLFDYELAGTITTIDESPRGIGNYGLDGTDLTISGNIVMGVGGTVNFEGSPNRDNGNWTVLGDISGPEGIAVTTSFTEGEVNFAGDHSYTGTTLFDRGTIIFNATQTGGGNVSVRNNAVLTGGGATTSQVTIEGSATLSPGDGVGTFATGNLIVNGTLEIEANNNTPGSGHDQVVATGAVTLGGASSLNFIAGGGLTSGPLVIINNDTASDLVSGSFSGLFEGASLDPVSTLIEGTTSYTLGDGNDTGINLAGYSVIAQWRVANFGSPANAGPGADSVVTANGFTNLMNFALNLGATAGVNTLNVDAGTNSILSLGPPAIWVDPATGRVYLRSTRRVDFGGSPVLITEQFSQDLTAFEDSLVAPTVIATGVGFDGAPIEAVQTELPAVLPVAGGQARYGRIQATTP